MRRLLALLLVAATLPAQPGDAIAVAVDDYLLEIDPARAAGKLERILSAATAPERLLDAVRRRPPPFARRFSFKLPHRGRALDVEVLVPRGHGPRSRPLPVAVNIKLGRIPDHITVPGAINVFVPGYDPPRGSDTLRDAFIKVLRAVAWRANGDPERLWATGFSWAGHATFDIALHRPGILRGIIPMAGAPRRRAFRLLPNLAGARIYAFCGTGDDDELLWNLKELKRHAKASKFDYELLLDPDVAGRLIPAPRGIPRVRSFVRESGPRKERGDTETLLADGPRVENAWIRIDAVTPAAVHVPERIPVSRSLSADGKRRATLRAMSRAVARLDVLKKEARGELRLTLRPRGVREATLFLRASFAAPGTKIRISGGRNGPIRREMALDPRTLLEETRRRGDRLDPVLVRVAVSLSR